MVVVLCVFVTASNSFYAFTGQTGECDAQSVRSGCRATTDKRQEEECG